MTQRSKKLGQCFLTDKNILNKILTVADVQPQDNVLEIGCGEGMLSKPLSDVAAKLTIIELDPHWLAVTKVLLEDVKTVSFVQGDAIKLRWSDHISAPCRLIANIPYQISAKVIKQFIAERANFTDGLLMVQKEFGQKLFALPGDDLYTSLAVYSQFYLEAKQEFLVSRGCFTPSPKVDSMVVSIRPKKEVPDIDEDIFFNLVRSAFWGRRKPIRSALKKSPYIKQKVDWKSSSFLAAEGGRRGETFSQSEFLELYEDILPLMG